VPKGFRSAKLIGNNKLSAWFFSISDNIEQKGQEKSYPFCSILLGDERNIPNGDTNHWAKSIDRSTDVGK
jgi:hypothetical protein